MGRLPTFSLLAAAACATARASPTTVQSALHARGDAAGRILDLTTVLVLGGGAIFAAVLLTLAIALGGPDRWRRLLASRRWIVAAGLIFPLVALSLLLLYTFGEAGAMGRQRQQAAAVRVQVIGELWWWRIRYLAPDGALLLETANELHLPLAQAAEVELASADVIHSFWVPSLAGKVDMIPGRVNRIRLVPTEAGTWRGQCAEFCGAQHARMALHVVVSTPADFGQWLQQQRLPARQGTASGLEVFTRYRCAVCHTIRGTAAGGTLGPDLTHVGSRGTLGAASLANGEAGLARWITHVQQIKPGSRMPAYPHMDPAELKALAGYLAGLQ